MSYLQLLKGRVASHTLPHICRSQGTSTFSSSSALLSAPRPCAWNKLPSAQGYADRLAPGLGLHTQQSVRRYACFPA